MGPWSQAGTDSCRSRAMPGCNALAASNRIAPPASAVRGTLVSLGFLEGLDHVAVVAAEGYLRHVDVAVAHGFHGEVFLGIHLSAGSKLGNRSARRGLGHLPAGVRVDFGIENQHVHVLA